MQKLLTASFLATLALIGNSCSSSSGGQRDLTGCGPIQWGMSVDQVKTALGDKAKLNRNLPNGKALETVDLTIGSVELSGLVYADAETGRVNAVHLLFHAGQPLKPDLVKQLLSELHGQYGNPTREIASTGGKSYVWTFRSGNVTLRDAQPAALFYSQNSSNADSLRPVAN